MAIDNDILDILVREPGLSSYEIGRRLEARTRATSLWAKRFTRWFGADSILVDLICEPTIARISIALERLEEQGLVRVVRGAATPERRGLRPLYFYPTDRGRHHENT
jgi:hypothetical protein